MEWFPTPSLPKHAGKPNCASIKEFHQLLTTNAVLVEIDLSGGKNGYLGIFLPPEQYGCIANTPFVRPSDPGRTSTIPEWTPPGEEKCLL